MGKRILSDHLCECGCGLYTYVLDRTSTRDRHRKGDAARFLYGHASQVRKTFNPQTARGKKKYREVYAPSHPRAGKDKRVVEHRLIAERVLGRELPEKAQVHHIDENRRNNQHNNLVICENQTYHYYLHISMRVLKAGGNPKTQSICARCKMVKNTEEFFPIRAETCRSMKKISQYCRDCDHARRKAWKQANPELARERKRGERGRRRLRLQQTAG